jgi:hypothetical protein
LYLKSQKWLIWTEVTNAWVEMDKTPYSEVNNLVKSGLEKQPLKKRHNGFTIEIFDFFLLKIFLRMMICNKNNFYKTY